MFEESTRAENVQSRKRRRSDDDEVHERRSANTLSKQQRPNEALGSTTRIFACPYTKHYPSTVQRSCHIGWHNIARLKEHLRRRHVLPEHCARCWREFQDQKSLDDHLQEVFICDITPRPQEHKQFMNQQQWGKIRQRGRQASDTDKWREIFQILFPGDRHLPSPFIDHYELPDRECNEVVNKFSQSLCEGLDELFGTYSAHSDPSFKQRLREYIHNMARVYSKNRRHEYTSVSSDCQPNDTQPKSSCSTPSSTSAQYEGALPSLNSSPIDYTSPLAVWDLIEPNFEYYIQPPHDQFASLQENECGNFYDLDAFQQYVPLVEGTIIPPVSIHSVIP